MAFRKVIIQLKAMNEYTKNKYVVSKCLFSWPRADTLGKLKYLQHVLLITKICINSKYISVQSAFNSDSFPQKNQTTHLLRRHYL